MSAEVKPDPNPALLSLRDLIQQDVGGRGLRTEPTANLVTACPDDLAGACHSIAGTENAKLLIVTGFHILHGQPPCSETDGPLGALFLARGQHAEHRPQHVGDRQGLLLLGVGQQDADPALVVGAGAGRDVLELGDRVRAVELGGT